MSTQTIFQFPPISWAHQLLLLLRYAVLRAEYVSIFAMIVQCNRCMLFHVLQLVPLFLLYLFPIFCKLLRTSFSRSSISSTVSVISV